MFPTATRAAAKAAKAAATTAAASSTAASGAAASPTRPIPKWKYMLWTVAFAAVTFTGTIYGAGLKTQQQWKAEKKRIQEASVDEKVSMLETQRAELLKQKREIEAKLAEVRARMDGEGQEGRGFTRGR
ncbi:hypothetical protein VTK56DRAFT_8384 [Thermocarpiscus australiensis]